MEEEEDLNLKEQISDNVQLSKQNSEGTQSVQNSIVPFNGPVDGSPRDSSESETESDSSEETESSGVSNEETDYYGAGPLMSEKDLKEEATKKKLQQMKRIAKQREQGPSKLIKQFRGLKSVQQLQHEHMIIRVKEGLDKLLKMHSPSELSSICGLVGLLDKTKMARKMMGPALPVQQSGETSISLIMSWILDKVDVVVDSSIGNVMDYPTLGSILEDRLKILLDSMWEGALLEYIVSIGHPIYSAMSDPRYAVRLLWQNGGFIETHYASFTPHFIVREVKKRYDWVHDEKTMEKLSNLRSAQERAKVAERDILSSSNFNNINAYFQSQRELRATENNFRDFILSELEITRSHIDSNMYIAETMKEQVKECEERYTTVCTKLNMDCAMQESALIEAFRQNILLESDIIRLSNFLDSNLSYYLKNEFNEGLPKALNRKNPIELCKLESCSAGVASMYEKLMKLRNIIDDSDKSMRQSSSDYRVSYDDDKQRIKDLEASLEKEIKRAERAEMRAKNAECGAREAIRKLSTLQANSEFLSLEHWQDLLLEKSRYGELEGKIRGLLPIMYAGLLDQNAMINKLCIRVSDYLGIIDPVEGWEIVERSHMEIEDMNSRMYRQSLKEAEAAAEAERVRFALEMEAIALKAKLASRGGTGKKKGGKATPKSPSRGGSSSGKSTGKRTATPKGRSVSTAGSKSTADGKKKSGTPSKGKAKSPSKSPAKSPKKKAGKSKSTDELMKDTDMAKLFSQTSIA